MSDEFKELIYNFLSRSYPIQRIKFNGRFKRAMYLDDNKKYILSERNSAKLIYTRLLDSLKTIFDLNQSESDEILTYFLNLK
jgi:hypothetical protein